MERDWLIMTHWLTRSWSLRSSTIHHVQTETWGRKWGTPWGWSYNSIQVLKPENQGSWWWCKSQPKGRRPIYWSVRQAKRKLMLFLTHGGGWSTFSSPPIQMLVHKETQPKMTPETKFNLGSSWLVKLTHKINLCRHVCVLSYFSHVWLCATLWTVARQAPLAMGFSKQQYWSGLPCPPEGDLPDPRMKPSLVVLLHWQANSLPLNHLLLTYKVLFVGYRGEVEICGDRCSVFHNISHKVCPTVTFYRLKAPQV